MQTHDEEKIPKSKPMTQTKTNGSLKTLPSGTPIELDTKCADTMVWVAHMHTYTLSQLKIK